jgi:hypothetical protein
MNTVTLSLPDCDGSTPAGAVEDFLAQMTQVDLWVYRVEMADGTVWLVDRADGTVTSACSSTETGQ